MHGAVGEVVHHDTIRVGSWFDGWIVNEHLNNPLHQHFGIPHVRRLNKENSFIHNMWKQRTDSIEKQKMVVDMPEAVILPQELQKRQFRQLTIF
jgi:hypothetical protein